MKQKILLIIILCVELFAFFQWTGCWNFTEPFHFSSSNLALHIIGDIHNDTNIPLWVIRVFHNKITGSLFDIITAYVSFWNISFLASFISFAGVLGLGAQFYAFFSQKRTIRLWMLFAFVMLTPFVEIFLSEKLPFALRLFLLVVPYLWWSMLGSWYLLKNNVNTKLIDGVIIVSLWYLLVLHLLPIFCLIH